MSSHFEERWHELVDEYLPTGGDERQRKPIRHSELVCRLMGDRAQSHRQAKEGRAAARRLEAAINAPIDLYAVEEVYQGPPFTSDSQPRAKLKPGPKSRFATEEERRVWRNFLGRRQTTREIAGRPDTAILRVYAYCHEVRALITAAGIARALKMRHGSVSTALTRLCRERVIRCMRSTRCAARSRPSFIYEWCD